MTALPRLLLCTALLAALTGCGRVSRDAGDAAASARLQHLEDREQIRQLLVDYGAKLDRHDFAAFGALFTEDAEYVSGGAPVRGREAIQAQLERIIGTNPSNLPGPNFHLSFNESIELDGDRASAVSLGAYTAPDPAGGATRLVFFVWYRDQLAREDGEWKFLRREVGSGALPPTVAR